MDSNGLCGYSSLCGHVSGHIGDEMGVLPDDLAVFVGAWPMLDEIERARIMAFIREASDPARS